MAEVVGTHPLICRRAGRRPTLLMGCAAGGGSTREGGVVAAIRVIVSLLALPSDSKSEIVSILLEVEGRLDLSSRRFSMPLRG